MHSFLPGRTPLLWRVLRVAVVLSILCTTLLVRPVSAQEVHVVGYGDSLSVIAANYGIAMRDLMAANGIADANIVVLGQRLVIPGADGAVSSYEATAASGSGYYTVQRGDSLSMIAQRNGMSLNDLMWLNGISNANYVWVGQQLRLSAQASASAISLDAQSTPQLAGDVYVVRFGDTLSQIAQNYGTTAQALMAANGLPNDNFVWVGQQLRIGGGSSVLEQAGYQTAAAPISHGGYRWIEVNLSNQTLTAWEGDVAVMHVSISSGVAATPTVVGSFSIYNKLPAQHMYGPGYDLPNVPSVMYFYSAYAIHGAYWHNNFGMPMSHGCVNVSPGDAAILYNWASVGTEVNVHY